MANWLNVTFSALDGGVFRALHSISNNFLTVLCQIITFFGDKGWLCIASGLVLILFAKTRKLGFTLLLAVAVGALFTNIIIKNAVARPRPYVASEEFKSYWQAVGANVESEYSFPSGHTTSIMAGAIALLLCCDKKWSFVGIIFALVMGFTRIYLTVHYTTDVIAGLLVGTVAGVIAYYGGNLALKIADKNKDKKFYSFILNADIKNLFKKKEKTEEN